MDKKTFLVVLLVAICVRIEAQITDNQNYRQLSEFPFVFVSDETVHVPPVINDSLFDVASRGIRFKVNRTDIQASDPFIPLYCEKLVPWLKSQDMQLRQVYVKGAASPEGPYQNNVRLSRERTRRLIDFLNKELGDVVIQKPVDAKSITEDYGLLVKMMQQAGDPDYDRVNQIWLSCHGDEACCKKKLMALDRGKVWRQMKQRYFPALRQARVILWFARKRPKKPDLDLVSEGVFAMEEPPATQGVEVKVPEPVLPQQPEEPVKYTRRHLIAARTNLVHDLLYVPQFGWAYGANIQLEYYPLKGHYTYNAGFTFTNHRHWSDYKFFQIRDFQLELRRYFRGGGVHKGLYLGAYGEFTKFGIGFSKSKGWEGEGGGGGLCLGYTCALNKKGSLRLELSVSAGVFIARHDPYVYGNPITGDEDGLYYYDYHGNTSEFTERNHQFNWFGPTNAGIHITYDIIYRKKKPVNEQEEGGLR